jgi:hypothetical protein
MVHYENQVMYGHNCLADLAATLAGLVKIILIRVPLTNHLEHLHSLAVDLLVLEQVHIACLLHTWQEPTGTIGLQRMMLQQITGAHNTAGTAGYSILYYTHTMSCAAGDTISFRGNQNSGQIWGGAWSTLCIDYIG